MLTERALATALAGEQAEIMHLAGPHLSERARHAIASAAFNGAVTPRPLAIVACRDERAVQAALRVASDHETPVSVLVGGHDFSGRGFGKGNLVLDLRPMSSVRLASDRHTVTVEGGALTRDLLEGLPPDLVTVTGTIQSVGVAGLTMAGGYGRLNSRFGLAADCLVGARIVLADGSIAIAGQDGDADLLWALRGGGGGFGAITAMTMAVHHVPRVLTATVLFGLDRARDALLRAQELIDRHPVELSLFMAFITPPGGSPTLLLGPLWSGEATAGEALLQEMTTLPGAVTPQQGWSSYRDTFDEEIEKAYPKGRHYHLPTRTLRRIDPRAAEFLVESARAMTASPHLSIVIHDAHGAIAQVAPDTTAFPLRDAHYVVQVVAGWHPSPEDDGERYRVWADGLCSALEDISLPGGYPNLLTPDETDRVRAFYGAAAERLLRVKRRVDPRDLFRSAIGRLTD